VKHLLTSVTLLAICFAGATPVPAQTVDDIVARNIEAKGGAATLRATTSVRTSARGTMQGQSVTSVTSTKRPFYFRNEITIKADGSGRAGMPGTQRMVQGYDGDNLWMAFGDRPAQVIPPGPQAESLKNSSQIDSPLLDYRQKGTTIELGAPATDAGRKLHHLIVTPKGAPAMHYYIDAATNLEAKMVIDVEGGGQSMKMEMRFSDFKTVDGRTVPFSVAQFVDGNEVVRLRFDKIEFDVPLDDSIFRMPSK
jgi:hypothetical protein